MTKKIIEKEVKEAKILVETHQDLNSENMNLSYDIYQLKSSKLRGYELAEEDIKKKIDERIKKLKREMKKYNKPEINEFYARINELKELKNLSESKK